MMNVRDAIVTSACSLVYERVKDNQLILAYMILRLARCFVSLPTGYRKTMCLFANGVWPSRPAWPPLLSYTGNQSTKCFDEQPSDDIESKGLCAAKLSECTDDTEARMIEKVTNGKYQVIYLSPESIFQKEWCDVYQSSAFKERLVGIAVDEAHCMQKWWVLSL